MASDPEKPGYIASRIEKRREGPRFLPKSLFHHSLDFPNVDRAQDESGIRLKFPVELLDGRTFR